MMNGTEIKYIFIIDTNKYAGNFERSMCAYCTGMIGECEVGQEEQAQFCKDLNIDDPYDYLFAEIIELRGDKHGYHRPVEIYPTPDTYTDRGKDLYSSVAIFFNKKPTPEMIALIKERSVKFAKTAKDCINKKHNIKILGYRLVEEKTTYTQIEQQVL